MCHRVRPPASYRPLGQANHSTPKQSLIRARVRRLSSDSGGIKHRHTVRVVNPLFNKDWADAIDHDNGVLVYARDLFDERIL